MGRVENVGGEEFAMIVREGVTVREQEAAQSASH